MKNNQNPTVHRVPVNPALIQAHSSVYRAMADVNFALKILAKHVAQGTEPGAYAPGRHSHIEGYLQNILFDIQRTIGRDILRGAEKQRHSKEKKVCHE